MSVNSEDLSWAVKAAIELLDASEMHKGALSMLPAGGNECEAKVASAVALLKDALAEWQQNQ